ncbi:MAG: hypothetical protein AAGG01_08395 [Planctomycetota bacterium]
MRTHLSLFILLIFAVSLLLETPLLAQVPTFEEGVLAAPSAASGERFGDEFDVGPGWLCAGVSERASGGLQRAGVVYAWPRVGAAYGAPVVVTSPDEEANGRFGTSLAIDESSASGGLVVCEERSTQFGSAASGVAHVYRSQGGGWALDASLPNPGFVTNLFGASVAHAGDLIAVGAPNQNSVGVVYVFRHGGGSWSLEGTLAPSDGAFADRFGDDVAVDGERIIVGAMRHRVGGLPQGAAYVFEAAGGAWSESGKLTSASGSGDLSLGVSVDIDGTTAVVGATRTNDVGAAYVYDLGGGAPTQVERLQPAALGNSATFGHSVAIRGDRLLVGAYQDTVVGQLTGSAWVLDRIGGAFQPRQRLVRTGLPSFHGFAVALDGAGRLAVGQPVGAAPGAPAASGSIGWYDRVDVIGSTYCDAVPNSTGRRAGIAGVGSTIAAVNDVELVAYGLPNQAFGFFITSQTQGFAAQPGGSEGNLCLGGAIGRYVGPGEVQSSEAIASFSLVLDLNRTPTPNGLVSTHAGESWSFQAWYRDSIQGVATSNFTEGLTLVFD